jgi:hypothetical protein
VITGYSIQVEGPDTTRSIPITREYTTVKEVCDLRPSTEYCFSVSAETVAGSGPAISVSFVMPQEGKASVYVHSLQVGTQYLVVCYMLWWGAYHYRPIARDVMGRAQWSVLEDNWSRFLWQKCTEAAFATHLQRR